MVQALTENNDLTSTLKLVFSWDALVTEEETGGTSIVSYNVQWDAGTNGQFWSNIVGYSSNFIETEYTATTAIMAGHSYLIKVRAKNFWGWGTFSDTISIKASTVPEKVDSPVTTIDSATGGLTISWTAPYDNADTITEYLIEA